jgi:organic radical activating enzyme
MIIPGKGIMTKSALEVRDELNAVSSSFCLAKWLQVTIHLQNGQTHSCHHPGTHKVPLEELKDDPSALHNTKTKKSYRKMMLEGERPKECEYCWRIEDAHKDNLSDRTFKSADDWAYPKLQEVSKLPWDQSVNPQYLEVSFGNECNFKCGYCAPHISSGLMSEYLKHGHYDSMPAFNLETLRNDGMFPHSKDEYNPYVDAFWKWWPGLSKDLKVFRITGGEPLLNPNTFKFLEYLKSHPMPELSLAINSNLGISKSTFNKFVEEIKFITENKLIKDFQLYTSVDTYGKNAEFIRFGLNYNEYMQNVRTFLKEVKEVQLVFMCTYNAFSVINFRKYLEEVTSLKDEFRNQFNHTRVLLDTPYLKDPSFLSCYVLTEEFWPYIKSDLAYIKEKAKPDEKTGTYIYYDHEISKFERILNWLESLEENEHRKNTRRALYQFLQEYQIRKEIKFSDYCPEYSEFYKLCEKISLEK